jgi:antitoxin component YwqK of YwqJK toxin-antitoxin module
MRTNTILFIFIILLMSNSGCQNRGNKNTSSRNDSLADTSTVPDTGFTGIKQLYSHKLLAREVTYKNGVKQGLMKTYLVGGQLYQTFWYRNGHLEDTAKWYYDDGKVFRTTPFKNDSMNGVQTQYYRNGKVRAKLSFVNGVQTPYLEEFSLDGRKITAYPDLVVKTRDEYKQNGTYKIWLELTDKTVKATYYRGEYIDGLFFPKKYSKLNSSETTGYLELKKSGNPKDNYVGVISEISTQLGNKYLVYKRIDLPYNDLK